MEAMISNLLSRFEQGRLSRRDLVQGLAMLATAGAAASAQAPAPESGCGSCPENSADRTCALPYYVCSGWLNPPSPWRDHGRSRRKTSSNAASLRREGQSPRR